MVRVLHAYVRFPNVHSYSREWPIIGPTCDKTSRFFHPREYLASPSLSLPGPGVHAKAVHREREGRRDVSRVRENEDRSVRVRYGFAGTGNVLDRYLVVSTCPSLRSTSPCITDRETQNEKGERERKKERKKEKKRKEKERTRGFAAPRW